jgi:hypothetical protein
MGFLCQFVFVFQRQMICPFAQKRWPIFPVAFLSRVLVADVRNLADWL